MGLGCIITSRHLLCPWLYAPSVCIFTGYSWNAKIILFTNEDYEHLERLYKIECNRIGCLFSPLKVKVEVTQSCPTLWNPLDSYSPWNSLDQNTGVGSLSLPPGIFPTQGSNPGLPYCRWILYQLSHKGRPRILEWVGIPFSSRSSQPRNWTGVRHCGQILYQLSYHTWTHRPTNQVDNGHTHRPRSAHWQNDIQADTHRYTETQSSSDRHPKTQTHPQTSWCRGQTGTDHLIETHTPTHSTPNSPCGVLKYCAFLILLVQFHSWSKFVLEVSI